MAARVSALRPLSLSPNPHDFPALSLANTRVTPSMSSPLMHGYYLRLSKSFLNQPDAFIKASAIVEDVQFGECVSQKRIL